MFSLKIDKGARIFKNLNTFINKGAKYKKNYIEGLN